MNDQDDTPHTNIDLPTTYEERITGIDLPPPCEERRSRYEDGRRSALKRVRRFYRFWNPLRDKVLLLVTVAILVGMPLALAAAMFHLDYVDLSFVVLMLMTMVFKLACASREQHVVKDMECVSIQFDAEILNFLISMHDSPLPTERNCAARLLERSLWQAQAGDLSQISEPQRSNLYLCLTGCNTGLIVEILKVLARADDGGGLPYVRRLAAGEWSAKRHKNIRQEAAACLNVLQTRLERSKASHTLLRASEMPLEPASALLRAAKPAHAEPVSEQLLRVI